MTQTKTCDKCQATKPLKRFAFVDPKCTKLGQTCLDCLNAKNAKHAAPQAIAACPVCKKLPQYGHDSWCTPERRANAEAERLATSPPPPMVVRQGPITFAGPPQRVRPDGPAAHFGLHPDELTYRGRRGGAANRARIERERQASRTPAAAPQAAPAAAVTEPRPGLAELMAKARASIRSDAELIAELIDRIKATKGATA